MGFGFQGFKCFSALRIQGCSSNCLGVVPQYRLNHKAALDISCLKIFECRVLKLLRFRGFVVLVLIEAWCFCGLRVDIFGCFVLRAWVCS